MKYFYSLLLLVYCLAACRKDRLVVTPVPPTVAPKVTSTEYIDSLLFVNKNNYQIQTSDTGATFSSADPHLIINRKGLIIRLTSAEVVPICITWKNPKFGKTTIYALGATDTVQDYPFKRYQGALATDSYSAYVQGWKTLQQLPDPSGTYAVVLRHADASCGADCGNFHGAPANWWKRTDTLYVRQLNAQGVDRATQLGQIFKDLNYPIKRVFTSEYYRARQTAELMNIGITPCIDSCINHPTHNNYAPGLFLGMDGIVANQPLDNQMTLIVAHHPLNELQGVTGFATFPSVTPFNWTGAYFVKVELGGTITYHGAASWGMFKRWRDMKLHR
ncbi:MAG: hypothetical protein NVSMB24_29430 [Mucilaginibacter sp.]